MEAKLTSSQEKAIEHGEGPMMVLAGPGSGKTFVITRRIRYLINKYKVPAENILVITFTKNSAVEMQERFENLMGEEYYPVIFGTFHSIFFHIIKSYYHYNFTNILKESEKYKYLKLVIDNHNKHCENNNYIDESCILNIISSISWLKNNSLNFDKLNIEYIDKNIFKDIYREYTELIKEQNKLDFDDMVIICKELLSNNSKELAKWRDKFKYILIDEFQDINPAQYELVKLLAAPSNNIFVVGDISIVSKIRRIKRGAYNSCEKVA